MAETKNTPFRLDRETKMKLQALAATRGMTMTDVVRRLIQEAPMTGISITYSVETDPAAYGIGEEHEELVSPLADRIERELASYMRDYYPGVEFATRRVWERQSHDARSRWSVAADDDNYTAEMWAQEIVVELDNYASDNYGDWLAQ